MSGPYEALLQLYGATHGVPVAAIQARPLADSAPAREAAWRSIFLALGFDGVAPTGSSRLFEVAMALSAAGGSPRELLRALHEVVAGDAPTNRAYEELIKELWIPAICHRDRFAAAFDFLRPVPATLSPRQAYLVLRFAARLDDYGADERAALTRALAGCELALLERPESA